MTPAQELHATYGRTWQLERADLEIWTATRRAGTSIHVVAGPPDELLGKLDSLPSAAGTIVRADVGGWRSGSCT